MAKGRSTPRRAKTAALPVVQPRGLRPKRPSLWRTGVLIAVHLVIIVHVAQWLLHGVTLSPVEPSEGMELAKHGVVNTGLVFFAAAILATAVFGRFFCGWGCHLVALQDLSRWLLLKVGLRPRPLRSRWLGLVPLVAFGYMFLWPAAYKLAVGAPLGPVTTAFTTASFWATFPGLAVAVVTFVVCGFVAVLVLGSKGFCTYACPYGAAFGLADRLAPVRVRVTDACEGCGTCTSVCTSNVRVHEEVRRHRMVVDPGCMKCLDCVASCPNQALYVGVGRPAVGRARGRPAPDRSRRGDELTAAFVFVLAFVGFRGLYSVVPFLLALGLAAVVAASAVALRRLIRGDDARLGPVRLARDGRWLRAGRLFAVAMIAVGALCVHALVFQGLAVASDRAWRGTADLRLAALDLQREPAAPSSDDRRRVGEAKRRLDRLRRWSPVESPENLVRAAWLAHLDGDDVAARDRIDRALARRPADAGGHLLAARLLAGDGRWSAAADAYSKVVELDPADPNGYLGLGTVLGRQGRVDDALGVFRRGVAAVPGSSDLRYNAGLCLAIQGDLDGAARELGQLVADDPEHRPARENLAGVLAASGRYDEAAAVYEEAVRRSPGDPQLRVLAARACLGAGMAGRARDHLEAAIGIDPSLEPALHMLDQAGLSR